MEENFYNSFIWNSTDLVTKLLLGRVIQGSFCAFAFSCNFPLTRSDLVEFDTNFVLIGYCIHLVSASMNDKDFLSRKDKASFTIVYSDI